MNVLEKLQNDYGMEAETDEQMSSDEFDYPVSCKMGWIGVGQGGGNIATMARLLGYTSVIGIHTSEQDIDQKILPPEKTTHKLLIGPAGKDGTAKNRALAREYALANTLEIRNAIEMAFQDEVEKIVVCLALGGGTGSGAGPRVIELAKEYVVKRGGNPKCDVIVIAAYPSPELDGAKACYNALEADREIEKLGVAVVPIDNANLLKPDNRVSLKDMWIGPNHWVVETFHRFNVYAAMESNLGRFDKEEWNDILSRGRFFYTMFTVPSLDNKTSISAKMGEHIKKTVFAETELDKAEAAGCILAINQEWLDAVPYDYVTNAFASINTILSGASTLHKGIYSEEFKKGKKTKHSTAAYGYTIFGGVRKPLKMLENLFNNSGDYFSEYSSFDAWRNS